MNTPIYDFASRYAKSGAIRLHMPGHKGTSTLGCESLDLTEINGADELFAPDGIIAESEANASALFGCRTLYSTEGSSLCIRAMLLLAMRYAAESGKPPVIAACRNAHKTFLTAAALLHFDVQWLQSESDSSYLSAYISVDTLEQHLQAQTVKPAAVWLTSPDYLGNLAGIRAIAEYCHANDMLLLVDCAHGAYLRFLQKSLHPIDLGADLCCTSAHKTLPVLTGGAYLHIRNGAPERLHTDAKHALAMFASTSPSYLILESLDLCNPYLHRDFSKRLQTFLPQLAKIRHTLRQYGWTICGDEPMKLTILSKPFGYTGTDLANILQNHHIYVEFADPDFVVLMPSPNNNADDLQRVCDVLCSIPHRTPIQDLPPRISSEQQPELPLSSVLSASTEALPIEQCIGRICAEFSVSCPPAIPIVICGERITEHHVHCMQYYGIASCRVIQ